MAKKIIIIDVDTNYSNSFLEEMKPHLQQWFDDRGKKIKVVAINAFNVQEKPKEPQEEPAPVRAISEATARRAVEFQLERYPYRHFIMDVWKRSGSLVQEVK